ncbi:MAG: 50S ribosomal protein L13 [Candidatus Eremiobacteraeota bacterium]|nr:50S ribosomal protein L13 [Candidatus Eremiobacteraeota bacterium]MBV8597160.1 50S ribosomal protein L13 [Candidatus Eremiobacteraeota bacterium]MBV8669948.1 50S ribosomal protein L13 [Candidatus Eremiobacteraeota bacterium]MBV8671233.1 50S ribosomal protein L13 [Candidatus Eremiobacteraeota bacterium]
MTTTLLSKQGVKRTWFIADAEGKTLGRFAARIAGVLMGKHKPDYTPHADTGDFVVVTNAAKIQLTGKKWSKKEYQKHSQYPGGLRTRTAAQVHAADPTRLVQAAVKGMLPTNHLRATRMKRLRIFPGAEHGHEAQKPTTLTGI